MNFIDIQYKREIERFQLKTEGYIVAVQNFRREIDKSMTLLLCFNGIFSFIIKSKLLVWFCDL